MSTIIENIRKNCMGTISFDMKAKGMRKAQDFIVYPIDNNTNRVYCQSDKKWVVIDTQTKTATISKKGNTSAHYNMFGCVDLEISEETLNNLFAYIRGTTSKKAGNNGIIYCDNSEAINI